MAKYVPSPRDWVREQVDLYESSGGTEGTTLRAPASALDGFRTASSPTALPSS
jgi:hypothetical protein